MQVISIDIHGLTLVKKVNHFVPNSVFIFTLSIVTFLSLPLYWFHTVLCQQGVGLGEMAATEKAAVCRQGAGVHRRQLVMDGVLDQLRLALGVSAPQEEYHGGLLVVEFGNHAVGELLPTLPLMAGGLSLPHGEHRIEQQHPLPRPSGQVAIRRSGFAHVGGQLLEHILEAGRRLHTG